ncbi:hypothetical protein [Methylobrevis albus]|uniref:Uncharacterized protein n=1 Tax=Methylobrevis albus TaxID=2793297 RepID=A0A931I644_9HYPH|nr:hypothetical protein [Methylobrevis albus]MBH0239518.1 hypothetical protein [Methylobrevis albus]
MNALVGVAMHVVAGLLLLLVLLFSPEPARAELVAVNGATGHGFVFTYRRHCYVILPSHVHGRKRRISILTAAPSATGDADIFRSFAPATDLSIGLVRPGFEPRCNDRWEDLPDRVDPLLDASDEGTLVRLSSTGLALHVPMAIVSRDYETFTAKPVGEEREAEIFQGISGAILRIDGQPVGMAIESGSVSEAVFLRIDAIRARLDRLLEGQGAAAEVAGGPEAETPAAGAAASGQGCTPGGLPLKSAVCNREPVAPEFGCSNLVTGEAAVLMPPGRFEMVVEIDRDDAVPVSEVSLAASPVEGESTAPKAVRIEIDSSASGRPRWRAFGTGDMTPFGAFLLRNGTAPYARRLKLTVEGTWDAAQPVTLGCVGVR